MSELPWIVEARSHVGLTEIAGAQHAEQILEFWKDIRRSGIRDDETPWCAAFVGACLERAGIRSTRFESARSYLDWGIGLRVGTVPADAAIYGCVVVLSRPGGGAAGHVGFAVGRDPAGHLLILGGNQGNQVNVRAFRRERVLACRWPDEYLYVSKHLPTPLPLVPVADFSTRES